MVLVLALLDWLQKLGALGLVPLGILDSSVLPLPGSMDVLTIILASSLPQRWPWYGLMATVGAVVGGYINFRIASKGGEEALEKKLGRKTLKKICCKFEKHGFITVAVGGMLPPPFPIAPVVMIPAVLKYPVQRFLAALALGRGLRFFALAYLASRWGGALFGLLSKYKRPGMYVLVALGLLIAAAAISYLKWYRPKRQAEQRQQGESVEDFPIPGDSEAEISKSA